MAVAKLDRTEGTYTKSFTLYIQPVGPIVCAEFVVDHDGRPELRLMAREENALSAAIEALGGKYHTNAQSHFTSQNTKEIAFLSENGINVADGMSPMVSRVTGVTMQQLVDAGLISQDVAQEIIVDAEKVFQDLMNEAGQKKLWTTKLSDAAPLALTMCRR